MPTLMIPSADELLSYKTLGPQVVQFIESHCTFGPGSLQDEPARLDDEKRALVYAFYSIYPLGHPRAGQRVFRRCVIELAKGLAKSELAAWIAFAELSPWAPVRFAGFDEHGELLPGRPVKSPYCPMLATAEEQAQGLSFAVLKYLVEKSDTRDLFGISLEMIVRLSEGGIDVGRAEAVSNKASTRDGARTTWQHLDEMHWVVLPLAKQSVATMNLNLGKRQFEDPWCLYSSTAGIPGLGSIEEDVRNEAEQVAAGKRESAAMFYFWRGASDRHDLTTREGRRDAVLEARGPIPEWGDGQIEGIVDLYSQDPNQWERVYCNTWRRSSSAAFSIEQAKTLLRPDEKLDEWAFVVLGFDPSLSDDATALVATEINTGRQQLIGLWQNPGDDPNWKIPIDDVGNTVAWAFEHLDVWRMFADMYPMAEQIALWANKYPDRVFEFRTNSQPAKMCQVARQYAEAIAEGQVRFVGPYTDDMFRHLANTGRRDLKTHDEHGVQWQMCKLNGQPQNKMDAAMAGAISWHARLKAIEEGATPRPRPGSGVPRLLYRM